MQQITKCPDNTLTFIFSHKHQSLGYDKNECTSHNDVELVDARTTIRSLLMPKYVDTKVKYMIGVR